MAVIWQPSRPLRVRPAVRGSASIDRTAIGSFCAKLSDARRRARTAARRSEACHVEDPWRELVTKLRRARGGYINLMSNGQHANCKIAGRESPEKIIIFGFEGSGTVVGLVYVLGSTMSESDPKKLFSHGTLRLIPDYPSPLMSVLPAPSGDALFESEDEGRLLRMSHEHGSSDRQIIQLFDLHAVKRETTPMQTCARETGTLRESGGRPVGSDLKGG